MKSKYKTIISATFIICLAVHWPGDILGQEAPAADKQLNHYLLTALKNNPSVNQNREVYNSIIQESVVTSSLPDPTVEAGILPAPIMLPMGSQRANIRVMQMTPWFGSLKAAGEEKQSMAAAMREQTRETASSVLFSVEEKYLRIGALEKEKVALNKSLAILNTLRELALTRMENGSIPSGAATGSMNKSGTLSSPAGGSAMNMGGGNGSSSGAEATMTQSSQPMGGSMGTANAGGLAAVYRLDMEIASVQNRLKVLRNNRITLVAEMNSLLNRPADEEIVTMDISPLALSSDLDRLAAEAITNNPMVSMAREDEAAARAAKRMAGLMRYPMLGFGVEYMVMGRNPDVVADMNGRDMIMPMVSATIPLWGKKNRATVSAAEYKLDAAEYFIEASENAVTSAVITQVNNYKNAADNIELYNRQSELSEKIIDIYITGFASGNQSLEDLLLVWQENLNFSIQKANAEAEAGTALAALKMLNGYPEITGAPIVEQENNKKIQ